MQTVDVMLVVLLAAAAIACGFAVLALMEAKKAMRSLTELTEQTRERLTPLLEKADVTVDAVNAEILRIDAIITQFEDAGARVSSASGAISELVHAPSELVTGVASRVRTVWKGRHHGKDRPESAAGDGTDSVDDTSTVA